MVKRGSKLIIGILFMVIMLSLFSYSNNSTLGSNINEQITNAKTIYDYSKTTTSDEMDGVFFGQYMQGKYGGNNEKSPIEWIVVERSNDRAILMSKYILNHMPYDIRLLKDYADYFDSDWEYSLVREWLNNEFYNEAFNDTEKNMILATYIDDDFGEHISNDKVFIMSEMDFRGYGLLNQPISGSRIATKGTEYARTIPYVLEKKYENQKNINTQAEYLDVSKETKKYKGGMSVYWLRSNDFPNGAACMGYDGVIDEKFPCFTNSSFISSIGVRPVITIKFDSKQYNENVQAELMRKNIKDQIARDRFFDYKTFSMSIENIIPSKDYQEAIPIDEYKTIEFGNYYYLGNEDNRKNIEWIVLDKNDETKEALLLSKNIIDYKRFDDGYDTKTNWEGCSLRAYLNEQFINKAFSNDEISVIVPKQIYCQIKYATSINTIDRIFCLSSSDCYKYFPEYSVTYNKGYGINIAPINPYVVYKSDDKASNQNGVGCYWLRDLGLVGDDVEIINTAGVSSNVSRGSKRYDAVGVRPALWVRYDGNNN